MARLRSCNDLFANHYEEKNSNEEFAGNDSSARIGANDGSDSSASRFRGSFFRHMLQAVLREVQQLCEETSNKSRIFGDIRQRDAEVAATMRRNLRRHCVKGIPRLRSYKKNCERFLQTS